MDFIIPVLVRRRKKRGRHQHTLQVLFAPTWEEQGEDLGPTSRRLARRLTKHLAQCARDDNTAALKYWSWHPEIERRTVKFRLTLRRSTERMNVETIVFKAFGHRIAIIPQMNNFAVDVRKGESVSKRVEAALTEYFMKEEKDEGDEPSEANFDKAFFLHTLELDVPNVRGRLPESNTNNFASLFSADRADGASELDRTGRCLDTLYPNELPRAIHRDDIVERLLQLLADKKRRPVLIVGPSKVGKTAVIQEAVWRRVDAREKKSSSKRNTWLLSPQRLVSGMMYVGQWEERLLAILKHARKQNLVLYFDDLLGLFLAGQTSNSSLSMAQMLKPHLEQSRVRVLAEATPETLRVLEETDRGFADLFQVIRINEPGQAEVLRILLASVRHLEQRHKNRFHPEAIATVYELQARYAPGVAFPGKAVDMLEQLAVRCRDDIGRDEVLGLFRVRSGLDLRMLDMSVRLPRDELHRDFSERLFGQPSAVDALVDSILLARTRLNEPGRPLANLLFVGPSGVGKTEAAKVAATLLYGHEDRLVRFDMNEFVEAFAVPRLIGTFQNPDGLLTAAIRRQPFCVLLLDEIEKAHPDLFDLLLQVLGEGRLTDALGRTVDFSNVLVLLTSNLGVREASKSLGFTADPTGENAAAQVAAHYRDAARDFFRPEFFNRLDQVVAFGALADESLEHIADGLVKQLLARDGVRQRNCILHLDDSLREPLLGMGRDPLLGARALKRSLERQVAQPLARRLAGMPPGVPTLIKVAAGDPLQVDVHELENAAQNPDVLNEQTLGENDLPAVRATIESLARDIAALEPGGAVPLEELSSEQSRYFTLREMLGELQQTFGRWQEDLERAKIPGVANTSRRHPNRRRYQHAGWDTTPSMTNLASLEAMQNALETLNIETYDPGRGERLAFELALLQQALRSKPEKVELQYTVVGGALVKESEPWAFLRQLGGMLDTISCIEFEATRPKDETPPTIVLRGLAVSQLAALLCGGQIFIDTRGSLSVGVLRLATPATESAVPEILRVHAPRSVADYRTGLHLSDQMSVEDLRRWTLAQLPLVLEPPPDDPPTSPNPEEAPHG